MKKAMIFKMAALMLAATVLTPGYVKAQEAEDDASLFNVGADLVSSYVWRGTKFGSGPAVQPFVELAVGGFSVGA